MSSVLGVLSLAMLLVASTSAQSSGWQFQPQLGDHGPVLTFNAGDPVSYKFECTSKEVIVTETGVTRLKDLKRGQLIADDANAVMPNGTAMMALFSGEGGPQFIWAEAVKNAVSGWDLTIRLSKGDKQIKAIGKAEMMPLFTTGYTMAVAMDSAARAKWNDFMQRCQT